MDVKHALTEHLRAAEAAGRGITDAEASLIETITAAVPDQAPAPQASPSYVNAAARPLPNGFTATQLDALVTAIREGRSATVQAAASLYDVTTPFGAPVRGLGPYVSLVNYFSANGAGVLGSIARKVGHVQTGEALMAADWVAGQAKTEITVNWNEATTHTPAAFSMVYEPNTLDVPTLSATLQALLTRAVVARENAAIAGDMLTAAQAATNNASAIQCAANAMSTVIGNGGTPGVFLAAPDTYAALIASAQFGYSSEVNVSTLFGLPLIGIGSMTSNMIVCADPRSIGIAYAQPVAWAGPTDVTKNEYAVRVESSVAAVLFDPYSIAKAEVGGA